MSAIRFYKSRRNSVMEKLFALNLRCELLGLKQFMLLGGCAAKTYQALNLTEFIVDENIQCVFGRDAGSELVRVRTLVE